MTYDFTNVLLFTIAGFGLSFLLLSLGALLRPKFPDPLKAVTYECGEVTIGRAWFNFNPRFYIIALVFVVFDVEIAFMYPVGAVLRDWALKGAGWFAFFEILVFVVVLLVGFVYVWAKGDLEWVKRIR